MTLEKTMSAIIITIKCVDASGTERYIVATVPAHEWIDDKCVATSVLFSDPFSLPPSMCFEIMGT